MSVPPETPPKPPEPEPELLIIWQPRASALWANLRLLLQPVRGEVAIPEQLRLVRAAWFTPHFPLRPMLTSLLLHLLLIILPLPSFPEKQRPPVRKLVSTHELTWYNPSHVLPPIRPLSREKKKPAPGGKPKQALPPPGEEKFHPRQRIISFPPKPDNPRLTLRQPDLVAPLEVKPKPLPNLVLWARSPLPPAPQLELAVKKLAPPKVSLPVPKPAELPANLEPNVAPINISSAAVENLRPKLIVPPSRTVAASASGEVPPAPAIDLPAGEGATDRLGRIIALSASPAPLAPVIDVPAGNLAAQFSVGPTGGAPGSPGGVSGGTPGAQGGTDGGPGGEAGGNGAEPAIQAADISISRVPGIPPGLLAGATGPVGEALTAGAVPQTSPRRAPAGGGRREIAHASLPPSGIIGREEIIPPTPGIEESILQGKKVYTLSINMPNLSSSSGSWILRFSELDQNSEKGAGDGNGAAGGLTGPVAVLKIDPRYSPDAVRERIEGQVVLYALIRKDGKVAGVQVLRGLDARLDQNAVTAFERWQFRPAKKAGVPVDLEAVVFIPFRLAEAF